MRGRKSALIIRLTDDEQQQLQAWNRSLTMPVGLVRRANAVLAVHAGQTIKQAAQTAQLSENHTRKWLKRFQAQRLPGLQDAGRPGRPPLFSPSSRRAHRENRL